MIYHHVALNTPIGLLTYRHPQAIAAGSRVLVPFRGKTVLGIVWASGITPDIAADKVLAVKEVLSDGWTLPENWRDLVSFAARYYHYPLGQTVFAALPQGLKEGRPQPLPAPPVRHRLSAAGRAQAAPSARARRQLALWQALAEEHGADAGSLKSLHPDAAKLVAQWQAQGWLETFAEAAAAPLSAPHPLNAGQSEAAQAIQAALGTYQTFLLYGITGSGKTEVYFEAAAQALAAGRQVLFLLPEINLTPQLMERVARRFPDIPTAVLHSQTPAGQRCRDYLRAMSGEAKLLIGTRLAVFTPLPDLGLIVVDEEHDASFKQDNELRYHARDLAVWRARQSGCPAVLGSATPSLESWRHAQEGGYRLLTLPERARSQARPPQVEILDVRKLKLEHGLSPQALALLRDNLAQGGLSLVYLNRRGFAPALFCSDCGHSFGCPHCAAKMVLHRRAGQLRCHHCDFRLPVPPRCPDCGNQDLSALGQGTQRVEEHLSLLLPQARIERVDRDSTARRQDWQTLYAAVAAGSVDILVGTQMLAKGHDFSRLNLVLVLNADGSLFSTDFRSGERLFAELMQVSGRAGRADSSGRVLIQTQLPEHPLFAAVRAQDYAAFAAQESEERRRYGLPPYGFQAALRADAPRFDEAAALLNGIKQQITPQLPPEVSQFGAVPMLMARLAGRERAQLFLESPSRPALHRAVSLWVQALHAQSERRIRWSADIDPQEM